MNQLILNLDKLRHNIRFLSRHCREHHLNITGIIKDPYADWKMISQMLELGFENIGISKVPDGPTTKPVFPNRPIYISLPSIHELPAIVQGFSVSFNSEMTVIEQLNRTAIAMNCPHSILLMVDTGDLREGVMPDQVVDTVRKIHQLTPRGIEFAGIGTNLGCCAGTVPNESNLGIMSQLADRIESKLDIEVNTVSVGGSVLLEWMQHKQLPGRINNIRLGESVFLGTIPTVNQVHPNLDARVVTFRSDILEIKDKRVTPPQLYGKDALGTLPRVGRQGLRKRAILNFGICDTYPFGLTPLIPGMEIVSVNSNYTLADITECHHPLKVGDFVDFTMNYQAFLQSFISPFTRVCYQEEPDKTAVL
ncbi:alanine racemase [Desulfobacter curvatus]|uniref:alanine racemase n=1 Tax=Desulfobacter curvatus TaxID=2290 RepID=UPI000365C4C1|nr:alanine racemase [Desulfobacter curvatus]